MHNLYDSIVFICIYVIHTIWTLWNTYSNIPFSRFFSLQNISVNDFFFNEPIKTCNSTCDIVKSNIDCCPKFPTGLNVIISIDQKLYE